MTTEYFKLRVKPVELLLIMALLGFIGSMAIPGFKASNLSSEDIISNTINTIRTTHANTIESYQRFPTVAELATSLKSKSRDTGIEYLSFGKSIIVPTYTDAACSQPTTSLADEVACVGIRSEYLAP
ncbi:MAG: hypothetical protein V3W04_05475 [Gammaproteobacteria bacterium]